MEDSLTKAFREYADLVHAVLGNHRIFDKHLGTLVIPTLSRDKRIEYLPMVIGQLERKGEFVQLITGTQAAFPDRYHTHDDYWTREAVQNFFRRSGFYLDVFEGKSIDSVRAFERYVTAFQVDKTEVT